ncbi:hypothetical protein AB0J55_00595 [Amycolatopsis sp. NPDC049688]|uniref:hypothetical protein n=1 Tax=Amycolatopsis sp. NPDC049688 TaxID=3154733 RepID=UPI00342FA90C
MRDPDADVIRVLRPKSVFGMLLGLLHLRSDRLAACDRGATITDVVQVLSDSGRGGRVVSQGSDGDRWSVTVPASGVARPGGTHAEAR